MPRTKTVEHKTPARGHIFGLPRIKITASNPTPPPSRPLFVSVAREVAHRVVEILPEGFDRVMPRGYTLSKETLLMAKFETNQGRGQALYARHCNWGEKEAMVFLRDLKEGWLDELESFMRWQLRTAPPANAMFQHALVHLQADVSKRLVVTPS